MYPPSLEKILSMKFSVFLLIKLVRSIFFVNDFHVLNRMNNYKFRRYRLWTFPVLVDGPFGVVSAAELIGILLFCGYVLWSLAVYVVQSQSMIERISLTLKDKR